jgi:hypothetical protein
LDLKKVQGQLLVTLDFTASDLSNHLFMCGAEAKWPLMAIFEPAEFWAI